MTLDRSKVWTGDLNAKALEPQPRVTVGLYDTTLRDGEQTVGVVFSPEQKLQIASALAEAGVDRIEAGFPRVSEDDARAIALIVEAGLGSEIWGFSRAVRADVEAIVELGLRSSVIESPISDAKLAALGVSRETMLDRIRAAIAFAASEGIRVAFFGVDSSRADLEFIRVVYETAVDAGAQEVVVVDTLGIATPEAAAFLVNEVVERLDYEVPVHWHGHDDFGLATAAAVAAVQAGATWVQGTVNGMGERAGNADLVEVALALEALYGIPTRLRLDRARALGALVQELAGTQLAAWKPVTGDNLFTRESGAVAAQFHDPPAIEPYASELVGAERGIVLGKKSGIDSIRIKVSELGLDVPEERYPELLEKVKRAGVKKGGLVTDVEFRRIANRILRNDRPRTRSLRGSRVGGSVSAEPPPADRSVD
jgi:isopropylmalate/homocitrate/citramalate synthase